MIFKRNIDPTLLTEASKDLFYPIALVRVDWPGELLELHTGAENVAHDGGAFSGTLINGQNLGQISIPSDAVGLRAVEASMTLYGPYAELLDRMNADAIGRQVKIWAGATTEPGGNILVGIPLEVFRGTISGDGLSAPTNDGSSGLIIRAKSGVHARVKAAMTHSNETQQVLYPGDTFFERNGRATAYRAAPPKW